jgi:hypothetical protein
MAAAPLSLSQVRDELRALALSDAPTAPDRRLQLVRQVIVPAAQSATDNDDALVACVVQACLDPWSTIRKDAANVFLRVFSSLTLEVQRDVLASLEKRASAPDAAWYEVHGVLLALSAARRLIHAVDAERLVSAFALPACGHAQLPVREVAVSYVADVAVGDAVRHGVLETVLAWLSEEQRPSPRVLGALALAVTMRPMGDTLVTKHQKILAVLAASEDDAAARQLVAELLSPSDPRFLATWQGDPRTQVALDFLQYPSWASNETGLLALDATLMKALKHSNDHGAHPYSSPTEAPPSLSVFESSASLLTRVCKLCADDRFETRRMATQILPLLCQVIVRRVHHGYHEAMPNIDVALTTTECLWHAGRFALIRRVLDLCGGASTPDLLVRVTEAAAKAHPDVAFAAAVYGKVTKRMASDAVPALVERFSGVPSSLATAALYDLAHCDPATALQCAPAFLTNDFESMPAHYQAACVAALTIAITESSRKPDAKAEPRQLFALVDHDEFSAPELLDGGADVSNGRAWIRHSRRQWSADPAEAGGMNLTDLEALAKAVVPRLRCAFVSRGTEPRVVAHLRHFMRAGAETAPPLLSSEDLLSWVVERLDGVSPDWRRDASVGQDNAASSSGSDWDASSDDDTNGAVAGVSARSELEAAQRVLAHVSDADVINESLREAFQRIRGTS